MPQDGEPLGLTGASSCSVVHDLPVPAYCCGADGRILSWNELARSLWTREPAPDDDDERLWSRLGRLTHDGRPLPYAATAVGLLRAGSDGPRFEQVLLHCGGRRILVSNSARRS